MIKKLCTIHLFSLLCATSVFSDELKSRPVEFGTGSSLTLDSGVPTNFLSGSTTTFHSGSTLDLTGATVVGFTAGVSSFNGRTGAVVPVAGDYTNSDIGLGSVTNDAQ